MSARPPVRARPYRSICVHPSASVSGFGGSAATGHALAGWLVSWLAGCAHAVSNPVAQLEWYNRRAVAAPLQLLQAPGTQAPRHATPAPTPMLAPTPTSSCFRGSLAPSFLFPLLCTQFPLFCAFLHGFGGRHTNTRTERKSLLSTAHKIQKKRKKRHHPSIHPSIHQLHPSIS